MKTRSLLYISILISLFVIVGSFFIGDIHARYDEPVGCTNWCACGRTAWPSCNCIACPCSSSCICGCTSADSQGKRSCQTPYHPSGCVAGEYRVSTCTYACICNESICSYGCYSDGSCKPDPDPNAPGSEIDCSVYKCENGYPDYNPVTESCVCIRNTSTTPSEDNCPPGTYYGVLDGTPQCIEYGDPQLPEDEDGESTCTETDTDCDPTEYCEQNGFTTTPTDYLLEDVVTCKARIKCTDVIRKGDCYENPYEPRPIPPIPDPDRQTLKVTMGENISNWVIQKVTANKYEGFFDELRRTISMFLY